MGEHDYAKKPLATNGLRRNMIAPPIMMVLMLNHEIKSLKINIIIKFRGASLKKNKLFREASRMKNTDTSVA